ncbi:hypothetical protein AB3480_32990 [Rhizobium mongolense]|uniref:hypothetical protein n=1 Tax=Rhizobium mongolense TaxID=57676 RepID=UPI0034A49C34
MSKDRNTRFVALLWLHLAAAAFFFVSSVQADEIDRFHGSAAGDPGAINALAVDPNRPPVCLRTEVQPSIATDNDRIDFVGMAEAVGGRPALLRGFRYNGFGQASEPEQIYCGCQLVTTTFVPDVDGGGQGTNVPGFRVPEDAPSGHYSIELLPDGATCEAGGIRASCPPLPEQCISPTLTVAPSHVVAVMTGLNVSDNGEDSDIHPAEMQFAFAGGSGTPFEEGNRLVEWSGGFPAGPEGVSYLTHSDQSTLRATVPLFAGPELQMSAAECREESVAVPANEEAEFRANCDSNQALGRYDNALEFGITGYEADSSPSKAWGVLAGAAAAAATCLAIEKAGRDCTSFGGITASGTIGGAVATVVNGSLEDEDDQFGSVTEALSLGSNWGIGVQFPSAQFSDGDISLDFETRRVAAPRLLQYSVRLKSITLHEGYELSGCPAPNEIFINSVARFQGGQSSSAAPIRIPDGSSVLSMDEGETQVVNTEIFSSGILLPENAPEIPFLYLETSVWERDSENDLIGFDADVIELAPIVARFDDFDTTPEGFLVRPGTFTRTQVFKGFGGSDDHCSIVATGISQEQGHASIQFEISLTWLPIPAGR